MMKFFLILVMTALAWLSRTFPAARGETVDNTAVLILGLLLVSAWIFGKGVRRLHIPMLSGFLLYGIVAGPQLLNIITARDLELLTFTDFFALSLIAITAGGELRIKSIRNRLSMYIYITGGQFLIVGLLTAAVVYLTRSFVPLFNDHGPAVTAVIAMSAAVISVANSPATVLAVIKEQEAKGPNSDLLLGVAVFKDIFIILIFAVVMAVSLGLMDRSGASASLLGTGLTIASHILLSIVIGLILGGFLILGIRYFNYNLAMVIVLSAVSAYLFVRILDLEAMLTCMVAGFTVQNFSRHGDELIKNTERSSMPFYIIFFTLAGARLDFGILARTWPIALTLVLTRFVFMFLSTRLGVMAAGGDRESSRYLWMGYLAQAGVSLGLVSIFQANFHANWADELSNILIASIAVNQIIGPVLLKYTLYKLREIPG